ncbi:MAG: PCMD domain-containing protein [Bacteroidetes bacterium]|nr:PCMD domain-containing protein [Bacteroidota bacterium]
MKKLFTLCLILFSLFFLQVAAQDDIPNKDFEQWDNFDTYEVPTYWDSPNAETGLVNIFEVTRDTVTVYQGLYSARLETMNVMGIATVPGLLTLGEFTVNFATQEFSITGGTPFTERPVKLTGHYRYAPQGGDACSFSIALTKYNSVSGQRDTIGAGLTVINTSAGSWTLFEVPVFYFSQEDPDSMNIVIFSSPPTNPVIGSVLIVDALEINLGVGVGEHGVVRDVTMSFDPYQNQLVINFTGPSAGQVLVSIYNATGQVLLKGQLMTATGHQSINMGRYPQGLYVIEVISGTERIIQKILR